MSCPICQKASDAAYRPFCSKRCADVDLARWFNEGYSLPASEEDDQPDVQVETSRPMRPH